MNLVIPRSIYVLAVAFLYGVVYYFWPTVPFDQTAFSLLIIAILGWVGVEVSAEVQALRADLRARGLLN